MYCQLVDDYGVAHLFEEQSGCLHRSLCGFAEAGDVAVESGRCLVRTCYTCLAYGAPDDAPRVLTEPCLRCGRGAGSAGSTAYLGLCLECASAVRSGMVWLAYYIDGSTLKNIGRELDLNTERIRQMRYRTDCAVMWHIKQSTSRPWMKRLVEAGAIPNWRGSAVLRSPNRDAPEPQPRGTRWQLTPEQRGVLCGALDKMQCALKAAGREA